MTIGLKGAGLVLATALLVSPLSSEAWFFSSASAQGNTSTSLADSDASAQDLSLMSPQIAMASDLKPVDEDAEITITDNDSLSPAIGSMGTLADMVDIPETDTISTYVVQHGDTIPKVAARFGVSQNTIRWANNLGPKDVLHVGETLAILPITGVKHVVVNGDTLASLAKEYHADVSDIADYNNMDVTGSLVVGDTIIIPDGEITIIKVVTDKKTGKTKTVVDTGSAVQPTGITVAHGYYIRPLPLGPGVQETQGFHTRYNAIDIGAPEGTPIHAMADGVVIVAKSPSEWNGGYGGLTIIAHPNGSQTLYAHQSKLLVTVGQQVKQNDVIGLVGHTGDVSGPTGNHLHFEIRGVYPTPVLYPNPYMK